MQIQRVNRTQAEKVFIIVNNQYGTTATTGLGMRFLGGIAAEVVSCDGVNAYLSADATMNQFCGIADQDIPSNGYGRVQAWGYVNSILMSAIADTTVGVTGITGSFLKHGTAAKGWISGQTEVGLTTFAYKFVQCWTTTNVSTPNTWASGFVRAL